MRRTYPPRRNYRRVIDDRWSPQCKIFTSVLEEAVLNEDGRINVVRVEIDEEECAELAGRYQVPNSKGGPIV